MAEGAKELGAWAEQIASASGGFDNPDDIAAAMDAAAERIDPTKFAKLIEEALIRGAMLGALDSMLEREGDEADPMPQLASWRALMQKRGDGDPFVKLPFDDATRLFNERKLLPRPLFDQLSDAAKQKSFTVAGLATEELLGDAHAELSRQISYSKERTHFDEATGKWVYKGVDLRSFDKFARERLERAGWTPANSSHVETVLRTNTMSAYSSGRHVEMTQPAVLKARPYWQIMGVGDSRQRKTHRKAHGTILAADHPFWRKAYPPFGFNCRCRVVSRSKRWVDERGGPTVVPEGLPDKGFASGIDASLVPEPIAVPSEGQRDPTKAKAPHQIHRIQPSPIPQPMATDPTISEKPPEMWVSPVAPVPVRINVVKAVEQGKHVREVTIGRGVTKSTAKKALEALHPDELKHLESYPLKELKLDLELRPVKGRKPSGCYSWTATGSVDEIAIGMNRPASMYGDEFVPGKCWSMSATRKTGATSIEATFHHEFGHRLHIRATRMVDDIIRDAYAKGNPITTYAGDNRQEYFAESYAAYRLDPDALRLHDPVGYKMVTDVLAFWGIALSHV